MYNPHIHSKPYVLIAVRPPALYVPPLPSGRCPRIGLRKGGGARLLDVKVSPPTGKTGNGEDLGTPMFSKTGNGEDLETQIVGKMGNGEDLGTPILRCRHRWRQHIRKKWNYACMYKKHTCMFRRRRRGHAGARLVCHPPGTPS